MHERNHELLDVKIKQYLLPAIMMKLALQLGNVVDTMLVGNLLGTDAMSAVSLSIPVLSLIQIPGFFLGNGGAIAAGILLGRRQKKEAREVFSTTLIITVFCGILFKTFRNGQNMNSVRTFIKAVKRSYSIFISLSHIACDV